MVHLHTHSWFSFRAGASSPQQLVEAAAAQGQAALALTDTNSVAGAVQFYKACGEQQIKPIIGAELTVDGCPLVLLALTRDGYANLCDLLTLAHYHRLEPHLSLNQLEGHTEHLLCLSGDRWGRLWQLVAARRHAEAVQWIELLRSLFPKLFFIELTHHYRPGDRLMMQTLVELGRHCRLHTVATNAIRHANPETYAVFDAVTCSRLGLTITDAHRLRPVNDQAYLKSAAAMAELGFPRTAIANTVAIARQCAVELLPDRVIPPRADVPDGINAPQYLWHLCEKALLRKYADRAAQHRARQILNKELGVIGELELDEFFLVVREVVMFARSRGIRCAGRGSAANSIVAYLLAITNVDPVRHNLLFERFLHTGRRGMPDVDVDFDSARRQEVIDWMPQRYGIAHTAMTANLVTYQLRLAVRDMMKVLGFPLNVIGQVGKALPHAYATGIAAYRADIESIIGASPMLETLIGLVEHIAGGPRHLAPSSGGMILSRQPLRFLSPVQTSANGTKQVQFAKDDVEGLGLIKFDVLGLRMMSAIAECIYRLQEDQGVELDIDAIPEDDEASFALIRSGKTIGLFQIESPGQMNLLSRTQPERFDDLVIQVALFRPGPLQGGMVHPFINRRLGMEKVKHLHPALEQVLGDTFGIILFQEQVLEVAHHFAGLSLSEADEFRRFMSKFRDPGQMEQMRGLFVQGAMRTHGVTNALANHVFDLVAAFVGYGFCRSHAAAFAQIAYQSAYLKAHHPAAYFAGLLEHKPGFYPVHSLLEEARHVGVRMLPVCVHKSDVIYRVEDGAIRLPFAQAAQMSAANAAGFVLERALEPFHDLEDAYRRVKLNRDCWEALARAGAFVSFGERRQILWQLGALARRLGPSGQAQGALDIATLTSDEIPAFEPLTKDETSNWDFVTMGLSTGPHPMALHRGRLAKLQVRPMRELMGMKPGKYVVAAGIVIIRQRPPTAKGMLFITLEDETGALQTAMAPDIYERYRVKVREKGLLVAGTLQGAGTGQRGEFRSLMVKRLCPLSEILNRYDGGYSGHPGQTAR